MNRLKIVWTSIVGSISSIIPLFFTVCKSGACGAVCVSPIASILGISSASLIASPWMQSLFPVLLVMSAVSFTVSYYNIYVLPKYSSNCDTNCACDSTSSSSVQQRVSVWTFWIGLLASIFFFSYFEFQNYQSNVSAQNNAKNTECQLPQTDTTINNVTSIDRSATDKPCCSGNSKCN